jgi:hypothetical protein
MMQELKRYLVAALDQLGQRPAGTRVRNCQQRLHLYFPTVAAAAAAAGASCGAGASCSCRALGELHMVHVVLA